MRPDFTPPPAAEKANAAAHEHFDFSSLPSNDLPPFPDREPGNADHPAPDLPELPDLPEVAAGLVPDLDFPDFFIA